MNKPKLLVWCDFVAPTGFANVAKNLLSEMYKTFDVYIVGINYFGNTQYDTSKYFIYSTPSLEDPLGVQVLYEKVVELQPEVIFLFQDIFHISRLIEKVKELRPSSHIITYFPIDGGPLQPSWVNIIKYSDEIITYTDWAIEMLQDAYPTECKNKVIHKLYHGVETSVFQPLPAEIIKEKRDTLGWDNKFVIINVNRFQPRKGIPITLQAFSMFSKGYKKCNKCGHIMTVNHSVCELNGCDSKHLGYMGNVKEDVVLYLHMNVKEPLMGNLENFARNAGLDSTGLVLQNRDIYKQPYTEAQLNNIYNIANINLSTTLGEGCGLSLLEAAAAGTYSIASNNSAVPEMVGKTGRLIPNSHVVNMAGDNGFSRPAVSAYNTYLTLETAYKEWKLLGKGKKVNKGCVNHIESKFLWQDKREFLLTLMKKYVILNKTGEQHEEGR